MKMTQQAQNYIKKLCLKNSNIFTTAYDYHFLGVVKYAKQMAKKTGADEELVEIAAWLHDIGSVLGDYENHHLSGAEEAEKFLKKLKYPKNKIENVKHCIVAHRGSKNIPRKTIEAKCLADADAMSHFDQITALFNLALVIRKNNIEEARQFVRNKLENSYKKLSPIAKKIIKPKYEAVKKLF